MSSSTTSASSAPSPFYQPPEHNPLALLDEHLSGSYILDGGIFTDEAETLLVRMLYACVIRRERSWDIPMLYKGLDEPAWNGPYFELSRLDLEVGEDGMYRPWSLKAHQDRGEKSIVENGGFPRRMVRDGRRCGKVLKRGDRCYTCITCLSNPDARLCAECFLAADHEGHDFVFSTIHSFMVICDCGDGSSYRKPEEACCANHPVRDTFDHASPPSPYKTLPHTKHGPRGVVEGVFRIVEFCLDYIIDIFQHSPPPSHHYELPKDEAELMGTWDSEYTQVPRETIWREGPWSVHLYADDRHTEKEIVRQLQHTLGCDEEKAVVLVRELAVNGRVELIVTDEQNHAFHVASMFAQIDMGVTLRHGYDTYKEQVAAVMIAWLADLCECHMDGDPDFFAKLVYAALCHERPKDLSAVEVAPDLNPLKVGEANVQKTRIRLDWLWAIDKRLWLKTKLKMRQIYSRINGLHDEVQTHMASRFTKYFIFHAESYLFDEREVDAAILQIMPSIIFVRGHAIAHAIAHDGLFEKMIDVMHAWFTNKTSAGRLRIPVMDRDRHSFDIIARTTFENDIPYNIKKGGLLMVYLRTMLGFKEVGKVVTKDAFFLDRFVSFADLFVGLQPQKHETKQHVKYEVDWYKSFALLHDLSHLCKEVGKVYRRASHAVATNAMQIVGSRIIRDTKQQTNTLDPTKYAKPAMHAHVGILTLHSEPHSKYDLYRVTVYGIEAFSFHHYLHYLLGELSISVYPPVNFIPKSTRGPRYMGGSLMEHFLGDPVANETQDQYLLVIDSVLTKFVVLSQIKCGLWKRNGSTMRHQAAAYNDIRESTSDLEFTLLQAAMVHLPHREVLAAILDRYDLLRFFSDDYRNIPAYTVPFEVPNHLMMMEECLILIAGLFNEFDDIQHVSYKKRTRRRIIHLLAVKNMPWSDLYLSLESYANDIPDLEQILLEVADLRPASDNVHGVYLLKPEMYQQVDIMYRHYTRNDRTRAIENVEKHLKQRDPENPSVFAKPLPVKLPGKESPYSKLNEFYLVNTAQRLVHYIIGTCMMCIDPTPWHEGIAFGLAGQARLPKVVLPQVEGLVNMGLLFAMVALHQDPHGFAYASIGSEQPVLPTYTTYRDRKGPTPNLFENLWAMQQNHGIKWDAVKPKVDYVLERICEQLPPHRYASYTEKCEADTRQAVSVKPDAGIKRAADRQKALMEEFAKKQSAFAAMMDMDDEDMEDEDEAVAEAAGEAKADVAESTEALEEYGNCIVCQDAITSLNPGGLLALFQPSRVIRETINDKDWFEESLQIPSCLDDATRKYKYGSSVIENSPTDAYPTDHNRFGVNISACRHYMHETCMTVYFDATRSRHNYQIHRNQPENVMRNEFMCPLCKGLGNMILICEASQTELRPIKFRYALGRPPPLKDCIRSISQEALRSIPDSAKIWEHHIENGQLAGWYADCKFDKNCGIHSAFAPPRAEQMKSTFKLITRFRQLVTQLSEQSQSIRGVKKAAIYIPEEIVGYTISMMEIAQRGVARLPGQATVAEQLTSVSLQTVKCLINELQLELDLFFGSGFDRTALRVGVMARFIPDWYRGSALPSPLLHRNPLTFVIEAAAIAPDLLHAVILLGYYAELSRAFIMITTVTRRHSSVWSHVPHQTNRDAYMGSDAQTVLGNMRRIGANIFKHASPYTDYDQIINDIPEDIVCKLLYMYTLPYLRRVAIIYHALTGSFPVTDASIVTDGCEYARLMSLMGISSPVETLADSSSTEYPIVSRWLSHWANHGRKPVALEFPGIYELVRLPTRMDYGVLYLEKQMCRQCETNPTNPAMCLYCGDIVCLGGDCCTVGEQGECNIHMRTCGAVTGMFLDISRWHVLLLYAGTGSYLMMPYLDNHGEGDSTRGRARPTELVMHRLETLRKDIWLGHGIPVTIARKLEPVSDAGGWGTL